MAGLEGRAPLIPTPALDEGERSASRSGSLTPVRETHYTH